MDTFTVYLFVRDNSGSQSSIAIRRRVQALQALREEFAAVGNVRVTALPYEADIQVEIRNVFSTNEEPPGTRSHGAKGHRVLIIRMLIADEPVDFVCADGIGNVPAEHHAAKRVLVWLYNLTQYQNRASRALVAGLTVNLSTN
jgi:hypothetical protein